MAPTNFWLSRSTTLALNGVVILVCVLFALGFLLPSSHLPTFAKLVCALPPALTILFFLPRAPGKMLAVAAILANVVVLVSTLVFLYRVASVNLTQPLLLLVAVLFVLLFVIPALSIASVTRCWPAGK